MGITATIVFASFLAMAFLTYYVALAVCCWTAAALSKSSAPGKEGDKHEKHVSVAINPHGPLTIQEHAGAATFFNRASLVDDRKQGLMSGGAIIVYGDTQCRTKDFKLTLPGAKDWSP